MAANTPKILIADPNPHVRGFLKREMATDGYEVLVAPNFQELLRLTFQQAAVDLIIVDPEFPDVPVHTLLTRLRNRVPRVPVIMHAHDVTVSDDLKGKGDLIIVEKRGNSIERLKQLAAQLLPPPGVNRSSGDKTAADTALTEPLQGGRPPADRRH